MTPVDRRDDTAREHPAVLPWYVSGRLEPDERARVEAHLRDCAECRGEVEALASMRRTHLAYRDDLEQLDHLDAPEAVRSAPAPWVWALLGAAAASIVFVALPALRGAGGRGESEGDRPPGPVLVAARPVVLLPARRDAAETPVLAGTGPWSIQVVLPLGSPEGEYLVRIARDGGGAIDGAETPATATTDGQVALIVRALPGPGRYTLTLVPAHANPAGSAVESGYPFEVTP